MLDQLLADIDGAKIDEKLKPLLKYLRKVNDAPASAAQADVDAVLAAGWDETAVVQALAVCALFNFMNRWIDGLGIETDNETARKAGRFHHDKGYNPA